MKPNLKIQHTMNYLALGIIAFYLSSFIAFGQEITAKVFDPTNVGYDSMKPLIRKLQDPKDNDFIYATDAETGKWRVSHVTIISPEVAAVNFDEGHVTVIGIFVRNHAKKQWELTTEVGGRFKTRVYADDPAESK